MTYERTQEKENENMRKEGRENWDNKMKRELLHKCETKNTESGHYKIQFNITDCRQNYLILNNKQN